MIPKRTRFFLAVEGESEQSFAKWLYDLTNQNHLHVHLETHVLGGGGFKSMLAEAVNLLKKGRAQGRYQDQFLILDSDRSMQGDWSIQKLRQEASKQKIKVCIQNPNHEAVLLRMISGWEKKNCDAASAGRHLKAVWVNYEKPLSARLLGQRFSLNDLLRMASADDDFRYLLQKIGLMNP